MYDNINEKKMEFYVKFVRVDEWMVMLEEDCKENRLEKVSFEN